MINAAAGSLERFKPLLNFTDCESATKNQAWRALKTHVGTSVLLCLFCLDANEECAIVIRGVSVRRG